MDVANQFVSTQSRREVREPEGQAWGCFFFWFVFFEHPKKMNATRQRPNLTRQKAK
jgi:hypothetical protein